MKKITLFITMIFCAFAWQSNAQFTEGFETEIPASWTVINNGGANGWIQENNPLGNAFEGTAVASLLYNATAHDDYLVTPSIDVTAGVNDRLSLYIKSGLGSFLEPYEILLSTSTPDVAGLTVVLQASSEAANTWVNLSYDLSSYAGQTVYVAVHATGTDEFQLFVDNFVLDGQVTDTLDYYNLQFPATGNIVIGENFEVYAQAYEAGLTDVTTDQAVGIESWIGYNTADTNPNGSDWTWIVADYNTPSGVNNNDEYFLNLGAVVPVTGTVYYASRWSLNTGPFTYGGIKADSSPGGIWGEDNNISGVLTVAGPGNDLCAGAIPLTPGADFAAGALGGQSQAGATGSGELPLPTCSTYDPADPTGFGGDVWFSVVVPADGNITIETNGDPTGSGGDSAMSVYTGACGALVEFECDDDDSADGLYSLVDISDPALANQTVYIRVFEYQGNNRLNFQISAYSSTLSIGEVDNANAFTYFPNPVKNELTLKAQSNIQNVTILNMLGQEVLRTAPNTLDSKVNMNELQTGTYFVKVTINDATETIKVLKQ